MQNFYAEFPGSCWMEVGQFGGKHVSGHEFTRAGPEFTRVINTLKKRRFLSVAGWRAAPFFGAKRLKKQAQNHLRDSF